MSRPDAMAVARSAICSSHGARSLGMHTLSLDAIECPGAGNGSQKAPEFGRWVCYVPTMVASLSGPAQIFVIRHGEKPGFEAGSGGSLGAVGVQEDGAANPHSLTARGWQRAGALAVLLGPSGRLSASQPTKLFAPDYGTQNPDHRTVETLDPLAQLLDLPIATPCAHDGGHDLVHHHVLTNTDAVVLVCWDHQNIPDILAALTTAANVTPVPTLPLGGWPDQRYDVILAFSRQSGPSLSYRFDEIPQLLLSGDARDPLTS